MVFFAFFGIFLFPFLVSAEEKKSVPHVVVSIKPLHSLVCCLMEGIGTPELLVKGSSSPHNFSLRPSDVKAVSRADLLVWIGSSFEIFLEKPVRNSRKNLDLLTLSEALSEKLLPVDSHHSCEDPDHDHGDLAKDYHFWLDPRLAGETVFLLAEKLSSLDETRRDLYFLNAEKTAKKLYALDLEIRKQLQPVKDVPFFVFHPAYQYFEKAYGLNQVGVIAINPERQPGARTVAEIRKRIREMKVQCVFSEPQFESKLVETLVEGTGAGRDVLDPLGADLTEGSEMYFILLKNLADNFSGGLLIKK